MSQHATANLLDRVIGYVSPRLAAERLYYRDAQASYRGGMPSRLDRPWHEGMTSVTGGRAVDRQRQASMRDRARQLDLDNAIASALLDRATENVIGVGIELRAATESETFNEQVDALFARWCRVADLTGRFSFGGMQQILYRQKLRDGDIGTILLDRGGEPRLQIIESDRIATPDDKAGFTGSFVDGVELNAVGRPVAYHVLTATELGRRNFTRVAAENFVMLARLKSSNSVRGLTSFAQSFHLFDHIDGYVEGCVIAARAAANQALLIKKNNSAKPYGNLPQQSNAAGIQQKIQRMEPGMVHYLNPDEDVVQMNPQHPTQSFPDFVAALSRFVGLNFGLTLEQVMLDFSRTSYSSSRNARIQADNTAYQEQQHFYDTFLARVWQWLVSKWVKSGEIKGDIPAEYWAHEWIPQGKPWVDPTKEIDAAIREVKELGTNAASNIALERGFKFRKVCQMQRKDEDVRNEFKLPSLLTMEAGTPVTSRSDNKAAK